METIQSKLAATSLTSGPATESDADSEVPRHEYAKAPALFSQAPPLRDTLVTESSRLQEDTVEECLPHMTNSDLELNSYGVPKLRRKEHITFLTHGLTGKYPTGFTAIDASRPWFPYWCLTGLYTLGVDVCQYAPRVTSTFQACQNETGGFGGGHGQLSHIATTYAAILSLITVLDPRSIMSENHEGTAMLDVINRMTLWQFLGQMKQPSGGFTMAAGGEEDIRGAYCAAVILSLLNLPLELPYDSPGRKAGYHLFTDGLGEWIGRCQTFEGGIGGAPDNEAHGGYAACGLGTLCILGAPQETLKQYLDVDGLLHWLSSRQHAPEGGLAGRTNKLVDGCYSHWVGGCWALISAALAQETPAVDNQQDLWSREGLARYILCCAQSRKGGLRDKPSKPADAYHSCYNLCGLSAAQNAFAYSSLKRSTQIKGEEKVACNKLTAAFDWHVAGPADVPCDESDRIRSVHPVFVIPSENAKACREYFENKAWMEASLKDA